METAQLETTSDIAELEQIALQVDKHVNARTDRRGSWGLSPAIGRASAARERAVEIAKPPPEKPAPVRATFVTCDVTCYTEFVAAIRDKLATLEIRYLDFDELAGFPTGWTGKVLGQSQVRRLGTDGIFVALRAAGLRFRIEDDPKQHAKMTARIADEFNPRQATQARTGNHAHPSQKVIDGVLEYLVKHGPTTLKKAIVEANLRLAAENRQSKAARFRSRPTRSAPLFLAGSAKQRAHLTQPRPGIR